MGNSSRFPSRFTASLLRGTAGPIKFRTTAICCHLLLLLTGVERVQGVVLDALASLAGAILAVLLMTRDELVRIPASSGLTEAQAAVFADLLFRVVFVVLLVAAILLVMRFARRILRVRQLLGR